AQAGGRGVPAALTSFFVCHQSSGASVGTKVEVESDEIQGNPSGNPIRVLVTLGNAILACAQANLFTPANPNTTPPTLREEIDPRDGLGSSFELKCYSVATQKKAGSTVNFDVDDVLGSTETVPVWRDIKLVCGPA